MFPSSKTTATLLALAAVCAVPVSAQNQQSTACATANDAITAMRLGKDRAGKAVRQNLAGAVALGDANVRACRSVDGFMLAYALARVDLAGQANQSNPVARNAMLNAAIADLEAIRSAVLANRSTRYEVFSILALIYYDTLQYTRSVAVADSATPFLTVMAPATRQKMLVTKGMAESQLGQRTAAAKTFDQAGSAGSLRARAVKRDMLGK